MLKWSYIGEGTFRCSLNLSPKFLADFPMYSSSHSILLHLNLYMTPLFKDWIFILRGHTEVLDGGSSFQVHFYAIFLQVLLKLSLSPWWYGTVIGGFWSGLLLGLKFQLLLLFFFGAGAWLLILTLLRAHVGYLHFFRLLYKCSTSFCN